MNDIFYGENPMTGSHLYFDRTDANYGNGLIIGDLHRGKTTLMREEIKQILPQKNTKVYVINPKGKFAPLPDATGKNDNLIVYDSESPMLSPQDWLFALKGIEGRIKENHSNNIHSWIFIDDLAFTLHDEEIMMFIERFYKIARSFGAIITSTISIPESLMYRGIIINNSGFIRILLPITSPISQFAIRRIFGLKREVIEARPEGDFYGKGLLVIPTIGLGHGVIPFRLRATP